MKNIIIYSLVAVCGVLVLANTRAKYQDKQELTYDYFFIEEFGGSVRFFENDIALPSVLKNKDFRRKYGWNGEKKFLLLQLDSLSKEKWELVQFQSNYNDEIDIYLYSAILKRRKDSQE